MHEVSNFEFLSVISVNMAVCACVTLFCMREYLSGSSAIVHSVV